MYKKIFLIWLTLFLINGCTNDSQNQGAKVQDGSAALIAFGKMQFTEMKEKEKDALVASLLQYCELDTLAMLMIYEHWNSCR